MRRGPIGWLAAACRFVADVARRWYYGRVGDLAASVTFWLLVSLPALVLALLAVIGPIDRFLSFVTGAQVDESTLEAEAILFTRRVFNDEVGVVESTISSLFAQSNSGLFILSLGLAFWSVSRGFAGLIRALEDIYDIEDRRPWYYTRVVAVLLGMGSIMLPIPLVILEQVLWAQIPDGTIERFLRTMLVVVVLILWASVLFHYGPAKRHRWRYDLPGAIVAAVLWWIMSLGFTWYVTRFATGVSSVVGASLLALSWLWMAAQVLLIGGAVNYLFGERLGVRRGRRPWTLPEVVRSSTDELKKIIVADPPPGEPEQTDGPKRLSDKSPSNKSPSNKPLPNKTAG